jgi:hypothetical protein
LPDPIHEETKEDKEHASDDSQPSKKTKAAAGACTLDLNEIEYGPKETIENVDFGLTKKIVAHLFLVGRCILRKRLRFP